MPRHVFNYPENELTADGWVNTAFVLNHLPEVPPDWALTMALRLSFMFGTAELHARANLARECRKKPTKPTAERVAELREAKYTIAEAEKIMRKEGYFGRSDP